jgi:DNA-binding response OmpR family regulator
MTLCRHAGEGVMLEQLTGGTILIVEDEILIGEALKAVLEDAGFLVVLAPDANNAVATLEQNRARDLAGLITDINLGGPRNGWEIASLAREMNPALPIVYMSGDSAADWTAHGVPHSVVLQKPFATSQIVVALSTLLNRTGLDG